MATRRVDYDDPDAMRQAFGGISARGRDFAQVCRAIRDGAFDVQNDEFEARLGRKPMSVREFVASAFPAA